MSLNFDSLFDDVELDFNCPECEFSFEVSIKELSKANNIITCPNCNVDIKVQHDSSVEKTKNDINDSLDDLENTFSDLQKTLNNF